MSRGFYVTIWLLCLIGWFVSFLVENILSMVFFAGVMWVAWAGILMSEPSNK
jgi:hypothetical protein